MTPELNPAVEVAHLRRLLDTQPSCLMRVGADGVVLAANDASLKLLGLESLEQALGMVFAAWILQDQRDRWSAFTSQVIQGSPASIECDITTPSGDRRTALLHGVPLNAHPDGVPSMAVSARAVSERRQLEAAMEAREVLLRKLETERTETQVRLGEAQATRRQLEATVHALEARQRQLEADREEERTRQRQALDSLMGQRELESPQAPDADELRRLRADLDARDTALGVALAERATAAAQRDQALADRHRDEVALEELDARHQRLTAERAAERARVLKMLQSVGMQHEQELRAAQSAPERSELLATLEERDATIRQLDAARAAVQAELDQAIAERARVESAMQEEAARYERRAAIDAAECVRLQQVVDFTAEQHRVERQARQRDAQERLSDLQKMEHDARQECDALQARLAELQTSEHDARQECGALQARLAELQTSEHDARQECGALQARLAELQTSEHDARQECGALQARLAELQTSERDARQECGKLQARLGELQASEHDARQEWGKLQARLAELQTSERDASRQCGQLRARLEQAINDRQQLETTLQLRETAQRELVTEQAAISAERDRLARAIADQAVQLQALAEHGRRLMPLASAGRAARDIASQLQQHVERVDNVATGVLVNGVIDSSMRPALELLRGEAMQASALAGELLLAGLCQQATEVAVIPPGNGHGRRA
jgi:PAS domain S-box-containing protein